MIEKRPGPCNGRRIPRVRGGRFMLHFARWMLVPAVVLAWLVAAGAASAALTAEVRDDGGFFKPETIRKANQEIKDLKHRTKKDLLVETYKTVPADKAEQVKNMNAEARNKFFS